MHLFEKIRREASRLGIFFELLAGMNDGHRAKPLLILLMRVACILPAALVWGLFKLVESYSEKLMEWVAATLPDSHIPRRAHVMYVENERWAESATICPKDHVDA